MYSVKLRTKKRRIIRLCGFGALLICAFFTGRIFVWAQVWQGPSSPPPVNNAGQPPTIGNSALYLRKSPPGTQTLQGRATGAFISSVPAQIADSASSAAVVSRSSFAPIPAVPAGNKGIFGYASSTDYGAFGFAEGSGVSYGVWGQVIGGGNAGYFFGPVQVAANGTIEGSLTADGAVSANSGFVCTQGLGCVVPASATALSASHTAGGFAVYGFSTKLSGIAVTIDDLAVNNSSPAPAYGTSNVGSGVGGKGTDGIYGVALGTQATAVYTGIAGYALDTTPSFRQRYGVQGVSSGGLGNKESYVTSFGSVDTTGVGVGLNLSLKIGTDGFPVFSYYDGGNGDLKVTKCGNANCTIGNTITAVDSTPDNVGLYASLAISTDGFPVISYYDITNGNLKVAKCGNASCSAANTITAVDTIGTVGQDTSLAIGTDGLPVISYHDATNADLKVAKCGNASCSAANTITAVDIAGIVGQYSSLAIGTDGLPVISYYQFISLTDGDLKVAKCGNAACSGGSTITAVDTTGDVGRYTSIAVDTSNIPVISYFDVTNGNLKVAKCGNASCSAANTITAVDIAGIVGQYTSLAIGTDGLPLISYFDDTNDDLKLAKCGNASCSSGNIFTAVDTTDIAGVYTSIAIGTDGFPVIIYTNALDNGIHVADCSSPTCSGLQYNYDLAAGVRACVKDPAGAVVNKNGIKGSRAVIGARFAGYFDGLGIGTCTIGGASCSTDSDCNPFNGITRIVDDLPSPGPLAVGSFSSMAIDSLNRPVIAHWDNTNQTIRIARCGNADCSSGNTIWSGFSPPIAARSSGFQIGMGSNPYVVYVTNPDNDIYLLACATADCNSPSNQYSRVAGDGAPGFTLELRFPRFARASNGLHAIAYINSSSASWGLHLARCKDASCTSFNNTSIALDVIPVANQYVGVAVPADNLPVISYYDTGAVLKVYKCTAATSTNPCSAGSFQTPVSLIGGFNTAGILNQSSMVLNPTTGFPIISYSNDPDGGGPILKRVEVIRCGSANCSIVAAGPNVVDSQGDAGGLPELASMALSATDSRPVIAYNVAPAPGIIKIAKCGDESCSPGTTITTTMSDSQISTGSGFDVAIPSDTGFPIVSYFSSLNSGDLKIAKCNNATCSAGGGGACLLPPGSGDRGHVMITGNGALRIGNTYLTKRNLKGMLCKAGFSQYCL